MNKGLCIISASVEIAVKRITHLYVAHLIVNATNAIKCQDSKSTKPHMLLSQLKSTAIHTSWLLKRLNPKQPEKRKVHSPRKTYTSPRWAAAPHA